MESIDSPSLISQNRQLHEACLETDDQQKQLSSVGLPDVTLTSEFTSLKLAPTSEGGITARSFLLLDGKENLKVSRRYIGFQKRT